jgi:CheY-like chemotaxis protein
MQTDLQPRTVLLVEDDEASQYIYATVLEHYGYSVVPARTGPHGLDLLQGTLPDIVVLDIGLPGIDGFGFLERMRADPRTARIPVLVVTVHVFDVDMERAHAAGCDVFLKKPLRPALLAEEVARVLDCRPAAEPV